MTFSENDLWWILLIVIWEFVWKGLALWRAAQYKQKGWYVSILIISSAGILPIIYLLTHPARSKPKDD